jgi:hypothetical protein
MAVTLVFLLPTVEHESWWAAYEKQAQLLAVKWSDETGTGHRN